MSSACARTCRHALKLANLPPLQLCTKALAPALELLGIQRMPDQQAIDRLCDFYRNKEKEGVVISHDQHVKHLLFIGKLAAQAGGPAEFKRRQGVQETLRAIPVLASPSVQQKQGKQQQGPEYLPAKALHLPLEPYLREAQASLEAVMELHFVAEELVGAAQFDGERRDTRLECACEGPEFLWSQGPGCCPFCCPYGQPALLSQHLLETG